MNKLLFNFVSFSLISLSTTGQAENLIQVYQQAILSNPEIHKSIANRDAIFEKINEKRSALLPQLGLSVNYSYINKFHNQNTNSGNTNITLQLTQTLFDISKWNSFSFQKKRAIIQNIAYQNDQQQLILKIATTYLQVLNTIDELIFTKAQKQAAYQQLNRNIKRFKAGTISISNVHRSRSQYYNVSANEITARNNLDNALESLRQISGNRYLELSSLKVEEFTTDKPQKIENLLKQAESHNLALLQARLNQDLAREQIIQTQERNLPTISLNISTGVSNTNYGKSEIQSSQQHKNSNTSQNKFDLKFFLPLYQGGVGNSQLKQAKCSFIVASEHLENVHRNVVQILRSSFNNVDSYINKINFYKKAVISAQNSLDSIQSRYPVNMRNMIDTYEVNTTIFILKQKLSNARYQYLINQLNIKQALGTLSQQDLQILNNRLGNSVSTCYK